MLITTKNARETQKIAELLAKELIPHTNRATVIALQGNLGSGKTTFTQGFARSLGIRENVLSPTFVLMKWYRLRKQNVFKHLVHIDCYRITSARELLHVGLRDIFRDQDAIILIEWADRIRERIPKDALWVTFRHGRNFNQRIIQRKA